MQTTETGTAPQSAAQSATERRAERRAARKARQRAAERALYLRAQADREARATALAAALAALPETERMAAPREDRAPQSVPLPVRDAAVREAACAQDVPVRVHRAWNAQSAPQSAVLSPETVAAHEDVTRARGQYVGARERIRARKITRRAVRLTARSGDCTVVTECPHVLDALPDETDLDALAEWPTTVYRTAEEGAVRGLLVAPCEDCQTVHAAATAAVHVVRCTGRALREARKRERRALTALERGQDFLEDGYALDAHAVYRAASTRVGTLEAERADALALVDMPDPFGHNSAGAAPTYVASPTADALAILRARETAPATVAGASQRRATHVCPDHHQ